MTIRRLPLEPLLDLFDDPAVDPNLHQGRKRQLACAIKADRAVIIRWSRDGGIPRYQADKVAVALGHHPAELWPFGWGY